MQTEDCIIRMYDREEKLASFCTGVSHFFVSRIHCSGSKSFFSRISCLSVPLSCCLSHDSSTSGNNIETNTSILLGFTKRILGKQVKEDVMEICSTYGRDKKGTQNFYRKTRREETMRKT
jgi:hypothetical protein